MSMNLFYCPSCARVYFLADGSFYICGRTHAQTVWADGKVRRFYISEKGDTNRPPWPIPKMSEERELLRQELSEVWIDDCKYPDDNDFGNYRRHFGYGAPGSRHLTREQVLQKYNDYVLRPADAEAAAASPPPLQLVAVKTTKVKDMIFGQTK